MSSYSEQFKVIKRYKVSEGSSIRVNCPFCGGYNTLGISLINGKLEWHCFRASCDCRGIANDNTIESLKGRLAPSGEVNHVGAPIPDFLVPITKPEHIEYLKSVHSYEAYISGLASIVYSPQANRILFKIQGYEGYTGRRLTQYGPKWIKYGDTKSLFTCGTGRIGVIVEDAPSACAVGIIPDYTGLSLLGTSLTSTHKAELFKYDKLLVCLDPDAAGKGVTLTSRLNGIRPTRTVLIPDDLKYYGPLEINQILKG